MPQVTNQRTRTTIHTASGKRESKWAITRIARDNRANETNSNFWFLKSKKDPSPEVLRKQSCLKIPDS